MIDIATLIPFLIASIGLTIAPGPDIIYVMTQSISNGAKAGLATAAGLVTGIIFHTTAVALGISALILSSENLFIFIKFLGSLYLVFLAYKTLKSEVSRIRVNEVPKEAYLVLYRRGIFMNVVNPKVTLFFLAFLPGFVDYSKGVTAQFYQLGLVFMLQAFVVFALVSVLSGTIFKTLRENPKSQTYLNYLQVVVFLGIALFIWL